jgi:glycosyltransferase involved in cell wall biosynthesis
MNANPQTESTGSGLAPGSVPVSVVIPTRNEERNLADCLDCLAFAAERIVFDSFSDDGTLAIAAAKGARVVQRAFDVFSAHKNWAIDNIGFAHGWILLVDADERVTPALAAEIAATVDRADAAPGSAAGYYIARQNFFAGKWIRHCGMYPDWQLRLFRRGRARYEDRIVHEHMLVDGPVGKLKHHFVHQDDKGIERYVDRHNVYSSLEAVEIHRLLTGRARDTIQPNIWRKGPPRRRALKNFAYRRLPLRAFCVFLYMYLGKLGFLDGRIGWRYCLLRAIYEYQIGLKLIELRNPQSAMWAKYRHWLER